MRRSSRLEDERGDTERGRSDEPRRVRGTSWTEQFVRGVKCFGRLIEGREEWEMAKWGRLARSCGEIEIRGDVVSQAGAAAASRAI